MKLIANRVRTEAILRNWGVQLGHGFKFWSAQAASPLFAWPSHKRRDHEAATWGSQVDGDYWWPCAVGKYPGESCVSDLLVVIFILPWFWQVYVLPYVWVMVRCFCEQHLKVSAVWISNFKNLLQAAYVFLMELVVQLHWYSKCRPQCLSKTRSGYMSLMLKVYCWIAWWRCSRPLWMRYGQLQDLRMWKTISNLLILSGTRQTRCMTSLTHYTSYLACQDCCIKQVKRYCTYTLCILEHSYDFHWSTLYWTESMQDFSEVHGVDEAIAYIAKTIKDKGPFDGFLAFSQVPTVHPPWNPLQILTSDIHPQTYGSYNWWEFGCILALQGAILGCALIGLQEKVFSCHVMSTLPEELVNPSPQSLGAYRDVLMSTNFNGWYDDYSTCEVIWACMYVKYNVNITSARRS